MHILGKNTSQGFLENFWEKKFLFIPKAISVPENAVTEEDLLTMANDAYFETRLIANENDIKEGPLDIKSFEELKSPWTLMIHNLNHYNEFAKSLEQSVDFVPKWLFDDVMCSYSSKGSKINAHIDNYNVLILQVSGTRKWLIDETPDKTYVEGASIKVLKNFNPKHEIILTPGDIVFIPPHVAHEGHSIEDSLSLSIGFKSLEDQDMMESYLLHLMEFIKSEDFFKLNLKDSSSSQFEVQDKTKLTIQEKFKAKLNDNDFFDKWLIDYLSTPKKIPEDDSSSLSYEDFLVKIRRCKICFDEFLNMSSIVKENAIVSINNNIFEMDMNSYGEMSEIVVNKHLEHSISENSKITKELYQLYSKNLLFIVEES